MSTHICPGCREPIPTGDGASKLIIGGHGYRTEYHDADCWLQAQVRAELVRVLPSVKSVETVAKNLICDAECVLADEGKLTG